MLRDYIETLRIKQWIKNGFLYAGIIFDGQLFNTAAVLNTTFGFIIFCLISSSVYYLNDIFDRDTDKIHPTKSKRPIASGNIPIPIALSVAFAISVLAFIAAFFLSHIFFKLCLIYFFMNIFYSIWLKHIPILDVMIIAAGFVIRVAAGVSLINVERFSPWLYVVTTLLSLFIGFGKRRSELALLSE
ncbi:MAG: UbiA prenyltransferase family protein, partial [Anaerolineaceae bacterium]|nr:UbiA prenyltransferase family protein [Anaerolineaceae bacterium]